MLDPKGRRRYDRLGTGGTTTLWVDGQRNLVRSFASLAGTFRNCAGRPTPWRSWLSAEECVYMPGPLDPRVDDRRPDVAERHGYVFEVEAGAWWTRPPSRPWAACVTRRWRSILRAASST